LSLLHRIGTAAVTCALMAPSAHASLVTYMDTEMLVRSSPVIVRGEVDSIVSRSDAAYANITTDVGVRVVETLRGNAGALRVQFRLLGGSIDGHQSFVYGSPAFTKGERVVLFLRPSKDGVLTVTGLYQGKFRIEAAGTGDVAVKERAAGAAEAVRSGQTREAERRPLSAFLDQVRDLVKHGPAPALRSASPAVGSAATLATPELGFTLRPLIPLRWNEPDTGLPVTMKFNPANAPSVVPGGARAQFEASSANWTAVTGSTIVMQDGGDTAAACFQKDGVSAVSHGDVCNQFPDFDAASCSGVLAVTGAANFTLQSKVVNGTSFLRFLEEDIVINSGTDCFFVDPGNYGEVIAHEMGHVIGLGHSCGDTFTPDCSTSPLADAALMNAFAHGDGRGATPQAGDINGARMIYPPPGFVDAVLNRSAFTTGQTLNLTGDFNGTARADLYVILAIPGGAFYAVGASSLNVLAPAAANVQLGFALARPLLSFSFAGTEAPGAYSAVVLLVRPGTNPADPANRLGADVASFTFTP
jgi:hypothetical protein